MKDDTRTADVLDKIYQRILTQLQQTITTQNTLYPILTQLCIKAQLQDKAVPLACLPIWGYLAVGGEEPTQAVPVAAAWRCLHLAGKLLNDVAKHASDPYLPLVSPAERLNAGVALTFLAQLILTDGSKCEIPDTLVLKFHADFAHTGLQAAAGQQFQLEKNDEWSLEKYETVVAQRSGMPFALALRTGAQLATKHANDTPHVQALADCGYQLGMMIQLADDFNGVWSPVGCSDLVVKSYSWPLLYAQTLADEACVQELQMLLKNAPEDPRAESQVREIMTTLGVPVVLVMESEKHRQLAEAALFSLPDSSARHLLLEMVQRLCLLPQTNQS